MNKEREANILSLEKEVAYRVSRAQRRLPWLAEDLRNSAWLGAIQAVDAFNAQAGVTLRTFAAHRIQGAMQDYLRDIDELSRGHRHLVQQGKAEAPQKIPLYDVVGSKDVVSERTNAVTRLCAKLDIEKLIRHAKLSPCQTIYLRLALDGFLQREIAEKMHVSESRVSHLSVDCMMKLRAVLGL